MFEKRLRMVGEQVREMRRARKMTQAELARKAGLSKNYISEIERGVTHATLESLFSISDAMDANLSTLLIPLDRTQDKGEIVVSIQGLLKLLQ